MKVVIFFGLYFMSETSLMHDGTSDGLWIFGTHATTASIFVIFITTMMEFKYWTLLHHLCIWASAGSYIFFMFFYSCWELFFGYSDMYNITCKLHTSVILIF